MQKWRSRSTQYVRPSRAIRNKRNSRHADCIHRGAQMSHKSRSHLKILDARRSIWNNSNTENPEKLGDTLKISSSGRSDTRGLRTPGVYATYSFHRASKLTVEVLIDDSLQRPTDTLHRWRGCYVIDCQTMSTGESSRVQSSTPPKESPSEEQSQMTVSPTLHFYKITFPQPLTPPCHLTLRTGTNVPPKQRIPA